VPHPAEHLLKFALSPSDESTPGTLSEHPEFAVVPASGLAAMAGGKRENKLDQFRRGVLGATTGGGAVAGATLGGKLSPDSPLVPAILGGLVGGGGSYLAARAALHALFPNREKDASILPELKAIKAESDRRNWRGKEQKLRTLMTKHPNDFVIDSHQGNLVGVTHVRTGFRYHTRRHIVPAGIKDTTKVHK